MNPKQSNNTPWHFYIGLMSGTSLDGTDGVLCEINSFGQTRTICHVHQVFPSALYQELVILQSPSSNELHREALAANALAIAYSKVVRELLHQAQLTSSQITAIGAHGQTIRHQPKLHDAFGYTWQSLNPALLAELSQIDVIADFRSRDIAANGQGAPLVPAFHASQFAHPTQSRAVLNIGGIANLTLLNPHQATLGFDTGPGNMLLNAWIQKQCGLAFDNQGQWAQSGTLIAPLLEQLLSNPYFSLPIPKSTGRELFHLSWIESNLNHLGGVYAPQDIQHTLTHLSAKTIIQELFKYDPECSELIICGGGALNSFLKALIQQYAGELLPNLQVVTSEIYEIDPQTVEGIAFAWLSWCFFEKHPANIPSVTGALGPRILGAHYPR